MWLIALGAALGLFASPVSAAQRFEVEAGLRDEGLVGAVWATVSGNGTIVTGAAGLKNAVTGVKLSESDRVQVGSVAKTLLAAGVLRLVSEGRLSLDDSVEVLLPDMRFDNRWSTTHPLRVRHLLDQTSGLEDTRLWQIFSRRPWQGVPLAEGVPRELGLRTPPGNRFSYSNTGYTLLGLIIERVTGERYEAYLDAKLLRPLGMVDSSFGYVTQVGANADSRLAMGHFEAGATQAAVPSYLRPAGQFTTTAADMAHFARFLMGDGVVGGKQFIDRQLLRAMGVPSGTEAVRAGLTAGYALGLQRRDRHGAVGLCQEGTTIGYRAMLCMFPDQQKAFFVAMNADSEAADYGRFNAMLVRVLGVAGAGTPPRGRMPKAVADWEGVYTLSPVRLESFAYLDEVFGFVRVEAVDGELRLKPLQGDERRLIPARGMTFRAADRATISHVLFTSANGTAVISDGFKTFERVSAWRIALLWASLAAGMIGLVYIAVAGLISVIRRRLRSSTPLFVPFLATIALALPVPLFLRQSFLTLGDVTAASVVLALVSGVLPLGMAFGLWRRLANGLNGWGARTEVLAMAGVLQWTVVLAVWGLMPIILWA